MAKPAKISAARQTEILNTPLVAVLPDGSRKAATITAQPRFPRVHIDGFGAFPGIEYSWYALDRIAAAGEFKFNPAH